MKKPTNIQAASAILMPTNTIDMTLWPHLSSEAAINGIVKNSALKAPITFLDYLLATIRDDREVFFAAIHKANYRQISYKGKRYTPAEWVEYYYGQSNDLMLVSATLESFAISLEEFFSDLGMPKYQKIISAIKGEIGRPETVMGPAAAALRRALGNGSYDERMFKALTYTFCRRCELKVDSYLSSSMCCYGNDDELRDIYCLFTASNSYYSLSGFAEMFCIILPVLMALLGKKDKNIIQFFHDIHLPRLFQQHEANARNVLNEYDDESLQEAVWFHPGRFFPRHLEYDSSIMPLVASCLYGQLSFGEDLT